MRKELYTAVLPAFLIFAGCSANSSAGSAQSPETDPPGEPAQIVTASPEPLPVQNSETEPSSVSAETEIVMDQYWEDGAFYTVADEKAALSLYRYSVAGEDMSRPRFEEGMDFVSAVQEESGYTCITIRDAKAQKDIPFRITTILKNAVPEITGWFSDDGAVISIDLKIPNEILTYPLTLENSRYGVYWVQRNYAVIDGFSLITYTILPEGQEDRIKGGEVLDRNNGCVLVSTGILNGNYAVAVNVNTQDVKDSERQELQEFAEMMPLVKLSE